MKGLDRLPSWRWFPAILVVVTLALPLGLSQFWVHVAVEILIMSLFAMSFTLLYGWVGQLSFGQAAFFGAGAYGVALMATKTSAPFFVCLLVGVLLGGLLAFVTGFLVVRLAGIYFAIMTVVVSQATFFIFFNWYDFTGGDNGIQGIFPPGILKDPYAYYYFSWCIVALALVLYYRILSSPFGNSLRSIRENMERATFIGIKVRLHMHIAFVIAGVYAALGGVLFVPFKRSVVPQLCDWVSSGNAVFMGILGGVYSIGGPIIGALAWVFLDAFVTGYTEYWPVIMGSIILLVVLYLPSGLAGLFKKS
jgi:branched-chain amino acid transport system permease protein